jgi:hypothetical protein
MSDPSTTRRMGFTRAATLVQTRIRKAGESRGFAVSRVLTHWAEIVGEDLARVCRPVGISHAKGGMGATLTVLTTGPQAPMLDMARDRIRDRVNAAYGHRAVSHVRITQTSAHGFAEAQAAFAGLPREAGPDPAVQAQAEAVASGIADTELRLALAALAANVLTRRKR